MLTPVELDHKGSLPADEVGDIRTERQLADELESVELPIPNELPEDMFRLGFVATQRASARN